MGGTEATQLSVEKLILLGKHTKKNERFFVLFFVTLFIFEFIYMCILSILHIYQRLKAKCGK